MANGQAAERLNIGDLLMAVEDAAPVAAAEVLAKRLAEVLGATEVSFLIADFSGGALIRLGHVSTRASKHGESSETAETVPLLGSLHGQALSTQSVVVQQEANETRLFAPVTNRGEAIGVLEMVVPGVADPLTLEDVAQAAHMLAYVVIANRRFTDLFEWGQRSVQLSLAAEIQHRLLPGAYTCEAGQFTLSAWLSPSGNVGGDTFDFSMDRDTLHLSITDAMGHEIDSAILATVLVCALRNARRAGVHLVEQARLANMALCSHTNESAFVTGQVVRIDLRTETATIVNAGHQLPLRLRDGRVEAVQLKADPPFGVLPDYEYRVQQFPLLPGDRLLFLTDGILERNANNVDVEGLLLAGARMHPREAVQHLVQSVIAEAEGEIIDDATVMCLDWHGGPERERTTDSGANPTETADSESQTQ
jgi:serine phosphatase RsbU (regulator of sigma subunit)